MIRFQSSDHHLLTRPGPTNIPLNRQLAQTDTFLNRHLGPNADENAQMLLRLGLRSMDELVNETVPGEIQLRERLDLGTLDKPRSESQALLSLRDMAERNQVFKSFIGAGYFECITPSVIQRNIRTSIYRLT